MDWPLAPSWFSFAKFQDTTASPGAVTLGDYNVPLSDAASASQVQGEEDRQGFGNCVLDGHVSYDLPGLTAYYWYRIKLDGVRATAPADLLAGTVARIVADPTPVPSYVQQWFTLWDASVTMFLPPSARIRKLVMSATLAEWTPPAGGRWPADPGLGPNCVNCPVEAVILWLQRDQNRQWTALVTSYPPYLAIMPTEPYPGVTSSVGLIFADKNGVLYQQTDVKTTLGNGMVTNQLSNAPITIVTDAAPEYSVKTVPIVPVSSGGGIGVMPVLLATPPPASPATTGALAVMPDPAPTVGQIVAPVVSAQAFTPPPTTAPVDWQKWALITGIAASVVIVFAFLKLKVK